MPIRAEATDPLSQHREGLTIRGPTGARRDDGPCPLVSTAISVTGRSGFATVETTRTFKNAESIPIEATLTFPVPIDAVLHGLAIEIDGRRLTASAQGRHQGRRTYEDAIDAGKAAVLHEEVLRGVHMVSVGQLPAGATCIVTSTWSTVTAAAGATRLLRIPTTVAEIYGRLPVNPADDILTGDIVTKASLRIRLSGGSAATVPGVVLKPASAGLEGQGQVDSRDQDLEAMVDLGHAIDIIVSAGATAAIEGRSADGRRVFLEVAPAAIGEAPLDLAILFDRSGSTGEAVGSHPDATVWSTTREAVRTLLRSLRGDDGVTLYEFDDTTARLGIAKGPSAAGLTKLLGPPRGGTEIGFAVETALADGATDILLLTDGRSGALDVHALAARGARISALLVGPASLEAMVGHLAALTGGRLACSSGGDATERLAALALALRTPARPSTSATATALPRSLQDIRGGSLVTVTWSDDPVEPLGADAVGAFGAALALPTMTEDAATAAALAHGLCTHLTSLVVVDEAGAVQDAIPETRKIPLPRPTSAAGMARFAAPQAAASSIPSPMSSPVPDRAAAPAMASAPASTNASPPAPDLRGAGLRINWWRLAAKLAAGNLEGLEPRDRRALEAAAALPEVIAAARSYGIPATAIAAALAAIGAEAANRSAARLVRKVEAALGASVLARLAESFGIMASAV